ncbi:hypothetical protein B7R21_07060 [Subtercola boreus]|uniref:Uncharacterized protein n=2 Tax=Subtercola boreus TaxID=120213 RepID=A0A3E0VX68_9MICO|nr:hypothetical protein B7R21_07060 [Subtercola boreus]
MTGNFLHYGPVVQWDLHAGMALPASERGHTCTISTTAPSGRKMILGTPWIGSPDSDVPLAVYSYGDVIVNSRTGGL